MRHLLIESPLSTIIWHPPIDNRAFLGAVESNIIWQGVCAYPCICNRRGDLGPSCGPCSDSSTSSILSGCNLEGTGNDCLRQPPTDDRAFVEVQVSSIEVTAQCWSKKENISLNA